MNPFVAVEPLAPAAAATMRRRAMFECCKWDPQIGDHAVLAPFALLLRDGEWERLAVLAAALARETLAAERELAQRPELHDRLSFARPLRKALARAATHGAPPGCARLMRFDFHATNDGWRISEVNSDVPGGMNEASGLAALFAEAHPDAESVGDVASAYARALADGSGASGGGAPIALVHATAYSDDRQVMEYLAKRLAALGVATCFASPAQLVWIDGRAELLDGARRPRPLARVVRFFPGEWLPELPSRCGWPAFFGGAATLQSNPATALLTQDKRFPLCWDALATPLPTWRALLPETRDPRDVAWRGSPEWVVKPALGRVGEGVAIPGLIDATTQRQLERAVRRAPQEFVVQRRFAATPLRIDATDRYPCVGVYTIDEQVVGAYGRVAARPWIDLHAADAPVLKPRLRIGARAVAGGA
ncbi:MAG: glutathionylspermidine synthase family protein [Planctomycetes bacterium]|nr:glutathionylspermidine synthase family protein [Planctomycetota bacterium]